MDVDASDSTYLRVVACWATLFALLFVTMRDPFLHTSSDGWQAVANISTILAHNFGYSALILVAVSVLSMLVYLWDMGKRKQFDTALDLKGDYAPYRDQTNQVSCACWIICSVSLIGLIINPLCLESTPWQMASNFTQTWQCDTKWHMIWSTFAFGIPGVQGIILSNSVTSAIKASIQEAKGYTDDRSIRAVARKNKVYGFFMSVQSFSILGCTAGVFFQVLTWFHVNGGAQWLRLLTLSLELTAALFVIVSALVRANVDYWYLTSKQGDEKSLYDATSIPFTAVGLLLFCNLAVYAYWWTQH